MTSRTAEIKLTIDLDADKVATRIQWQAEEAPGGGVATCQSMMLALWDGEKKTTAAIDLWTRDMTIDDMNFFYYQVLHKMADTYLRATKNAPIAEAIHELGNKLGDTLGLR